MLTIKSAEATAPSTVRALRSPCCNPLQRKPVTAKCHTCARHIISASDSNQRGLHLCAANSALPAGWIQNDRYQSPAATTTRTMTCCICCQMYKAHPTLAAECRRTPDTCQGQPGLSKISSLVTVRLAPHNQHWLVAAPCSQQPKLSSRKLSHQQQTCQHVPYNLLRRNTCMSVAARRAGHVQHKSFLPGLCPATNKWGHSQAHTCRLTHAGMCMHMAPVKHRACTTGGDRAE